MAKTFEELWAELSEKSTSADPQSATVSALNSGTRFIARKVLEEAGEVFAAAAAENDRAELALEISQLLYWLQVLMLSENLDLSDIYERL